MPRNWHLILLSAVWACLVSVSMVRANGVGKPPLNMFIAIDLGLPLTALDGLDLDTVNLYELAADHGFQSAPGVTNKALLIPDPDIDPLGYDAYVEKLVESWEQPPVLVPMPMPPPFVFGTSISDYYQAYHTLPNLLTAVPASPEPTSAGLFLVGSFAFLFRKKSRTPYH